MACVLCLVDKTLARKACVDCVWLPRNWQSEIVLYLVAKKVGGNECVHAHRRGCLVAKEGPESVCMRCLVAKKVGK